jgi:Cu(I)/Ag(I) efflux system membrane fusion protein
VVSSGLTEGEEIAMNGVFKIDAAAQLAGKPSMMNPEGDKVSTGHDHGGTPMSDEEMENMDAKESQKKKIKSAAVKHEMVKVYGNCEMCKNRIEEAAKNVVGVISADWDIDSKMLHLEFDHEKVSLETVEKAIASVGHDTEHSRAPDNVYDELPGCCLYERPGNLSE